MSDTSRNNKSAKKSYSVSSAATSKTPRTVSFSVPTLPKPNLEFIKKINSSQWRSGILAGLFILIAMLSGFVGAWFDTRNNPGLTSSATVSSEKKIVTSDSQLISQIASTVGPSVVSVNVDISTTGSNTEEGGFGLFGFQQPEDEEAAGTGIIISSSGIIVTNRHVVPVGTTSVSVTLSNGTELKDVSVIGRTSSSSSLDIAFLKINNAEGQKLVPATIGDSSTVQVGDDVVAIGNALGQFQNTVTSGIISGYGRTVQASEDNGSGSLDLSSDTENLDDLFQTDAAINEGNSGGPLVNLNGQVIGINTAIAGDAQNIGFAIPINDVKGLINQVIKTGSFQQPYLGVSYIPLTADVANEYNLSVQNGAFIAPSSNPSSPSVIAGSPAAAAGLQNNDIITQVNGVSIGQANSLTSLLDQYSPGNQVSLTVLRNGQTLHINVTLGTMPDSN